MKKIILVLMTICMLMLFVKCSAENKSAAKPAYTDNFPKGEIIANVGCKSDNSETYALYLPSYYTTDKKFPIIYCFDPKGLGKIPLDSMKDLAEKYGYILAGSNNSRNGVPWEQVSRSVTMLFSDTYNRISIDERRVYTAGFSGGARVAGAVAVFMGGVEGVMACSGALPQTEEGIQNYFNFIGMVGNEDFNYWEMVDLDKALDNTKLKHQLIIFDGRHDWSPKPVLEDGFLWFEFNAMKSRLIPINDTLVANFENKLNDEINSMRQKQKPVDSYYPLYKKMFNYLDGLRDMSKYKELFDELSNSKEIQKANERDNNLKAKEETKKQEYLKAFSTQNLKWWQEEIKKINENIQKSRVSAETLYNKRLLRFLSLASFMSCNAALSKGDRKLSELLIAIYSMVDEENPDYDFLLAKLYEKTGNHDKVFPALENSVRKGFNDKHRLETDDILGKLKDTKEFKEIVSKIK